MSDRENLSGFDMQEYWDYFHNVNKQFNSIFGVQDEDERNNGEIGRTVSRDSDKLESGGNKQG
jgi:hypothetical protein